MMPAIASQNTTQQRIQRKAAFTLVGLPAEERLVKFAADVRDGLTLRPKTLPSFYFYDRLGSLLFEAICELPEYYLTRAETAILHAHADEIAGLFRGPTDLIELGSGNGIKTRLLIEAFLRRQPVQRYVPLDICRDVLEESSQGLLQRYPGLEILAIAAEYEEGLEHLRTASARDKLILWLGSNVGNLDRARAIQFLSRVRRLMDPPDRLLIGFDLRKDRTRIEAAYNDASGVTAAFNRNLLVRINRELGGHFDVKAFRHRAVYKETLGRIEAYLISDVPQRVRIDELGIQVSLKRGEAIHTENSHKYSPAEITRLAAAAGLRCASHWIDADNLFNLTLMAPG